MTNLQKAAYAAMQRREAIKQVRKAEASGCAKRVARARVVLGKYMVGKGDKRQTTGERV